MLRLVRLVTLVDEDQLLREDAGVTRLEASPLEVFSRALMRL
jgi:hypothetical protein